MARRNQTRIRLSPLQPGPRVARRRNTLAPFAVAVAVLAIIAFGVAWLT